MSAAFDRLAAVTERLIAAVQHDTGPNGGLQSAATVRAADEARLELSRLRAGAAVATSGAGA